MFSVSESLLLVLDVTSSRFMSGSAAISLSYSFFEVSLRLSLKMLNVDGLIFSPSKLVTKTLEKSSFEMSRTSFLFLGVNMILFFQRFCWTSANDFGGCFLINCHSLVLSFARRSLLLELDLLLGLSSTKALVDSDFGLFKP